MAVNPALLHVPGETSPCHGCGKPETAWPETYICTYMTGREPMYAKGVYYMWFGISMYITGLYTKITKRKAYWMAEIAVHRINDNVCWLQVVAPNISFYNNVLTSYFGARNAFFSGGIYSGCVICAKCVSTLLEQGILVPLVKLLLTWHGTLILLIFYCYCCEIYSDIHTRLSACWC